MVLALGYTPLFLGLDVIPLGLAFTGWGLGLAAGILVIGHRRAHRIGAVQTVGVAIAGLLVCMVLFATSTSTTEALVVLVLAVGVLVYLAFAHVMAAGCGERVLWSRWNRAAAGTEHALEEPVGEAY